MAKNANPFQRSGNHDPKLALLRRADTERDTAHTIGGKTRLASKNPISLAPVPSLQKPYDQCGNED